jgi:hypothetical protein
VFKRCRVRGSWRLTAEGLDRDSALAVLRKRRSLVRPWPGCRVGRHGTIALIVPGRNANAKFRGRLQEDDGGALVVSGVTVETVSAFVLPQMMAFAALLMLGVVVAGALTVTAPPLIIGLVAAPVLGTLSVLLARSRGAGYDVHAGRLHRDLETLLAPLDPQPVDQPSQRHRGLH